MSSGKMGAPHGIRHGKAVHSFEFIERLRDEYDAGARPKDLAARHGIPLDTLKDWVYLRTRNYG